MSDLQCAHLEYAIAKIRQYEARCEALAAKHNVAVASRRRKRRAKR